MHPCGKYRYNSLSIILAKEYGYVNLRSKLEKTLLFLRTNITLTYFVLIRRK